MVMASSSRKICSTLAVKPNQLYLMRGYCSKPLLTNALNPELRASRPKVMAHGFSIGRSTLHSPEGILMMKSEIEKMKIDQRKYYSILHATNAKAQCDYEEMDKVKRELKESNANETNISVRVEDLRETLRQYEFYRQKINEIEQNNAVIMEKILKLKSMSTQAKDEEFGQVNEEITEVKAEIEEQNTKEPQLSAVEMEDIKEKETGKLEFLDSVGATILGFILWALYLGLCWCITAFFAFCSKFVCLALMSLGRLY